MADSIESSENSIASTPIRMSTYEGQGPDIVVSSPSTPRRSIYMQTPAAIKKQLQDQLNEKANQIRITAELGQALIKQQNELEQRIQELDQTQGDEVPQELKDKLAELEKQANALEANTAKVFLGTKGLTSGGIDLAGSTGSPGPSATSMADSTPTTTTTGRPSRRELNKAKKRKDDIELATEIGQGLLVEIRRLQALLQEKEEKIKELEVDKAELERMIDVLNKQIRGKEESEERYKDENWNLELMKQDMSAQLDDLQQQLNKARNDYSKIEKALAAATDVIDQLKDKEERLTAEYYNLKTRHDQDMANNRRHVAALNREKNDLLKNLEELRAQLASLQATRNIRKRTPEPGAGPNDDELGQPIPSDNDTSSEGVPTALQGKNLNKEETLKALGIAKDMIGSLRANLQKEKSEKYELKKLLADSQEQIEAMRYETEFDPAAIYNKKVKKNKRSKRLSAASNGLPNINEDESQDDNDDSGDDEIIINKDNRPSSDMFRPHGWKPDLLRKSRNSARSSIMSSRIDEDIPGDDFDEIEDDDEVVAAQRAEALNNLTKPKRSSSRLSVKQSSIEDPESFDFTGDAKSLKSRDSVVRKRVSEYEDFVSRKNSKDKLINPETGEEEEIKDDASSVDSFTSANETNLDSKRESTTSKRNSKRGSNRESSTLLSSDSPSDSLTKNISEEIVPTKEFKDVAVQTEAGRSDSLSTIHTGKFTFGNRDTVYDALRDSKDIPNTRQSVASVHEDNNIDNRFTLDLSSGNRKNLQSQQGHLDPPPRPTNSPPPTLIHPPTVNFGQQAGSPKIPHHPLNLGRKGSADSQDIQNAIGNGAIPRSNHQHTLSSGSISTVSSTSTSAEQVGRSDTSHVEAGSSTGPSTGPMTGPMTGPSGTDPNIIHAITQTMIGEYLWKYTRKNFGAGISEKRHKRFFWVHPYTKTLYWSIRDPGSYEPVDPKSKGGMSYFAYIESVRQVVDHNPSPPGLHHMSLVIKTPERELKFTARSKERHEYWFQALSYLLQRPDEAGQIGQGQTPGRIAKNGSDPWENQANMQNLRNNTSPNGSLKGANPREIKKKSSFSKIQAMFRRDGSSSSPTSPLSTEFVDGQHQQFAIPGPSNSNIDDDDEDLENVRQCCDGRHDVSKLERAPHKHHHHHNGHY